MVGNRQSPLKVGITVVPNAASLICGKALVLHLPRLQRHHMKSDIYSSLKWAIFLILPVTATGMAFMMFTLSSGVVALAVVSGFFCPSVIFWFFLKGTPPTGNLFSIAVFLLSQFAYCALLSFSWIKLTRCQHRKNLS